MLISGKQSKGFIVGGLKKTLPSPPFSLILFIHFFFIFHIYLKKDKIVEICK
jgi:hypothetical protein